MSKNNGGFGFSFGRDDDDEEKNNNQNSPFDFLFGMGGGNGSNNAGDMNNIFGAGLSDVVNQFGEMLFGGGKDFSMGTAKEMALQALSPYEEPMPRDADTVVRDSVYMSELWLNDATVLDATNGLPTAISPRTYIEEFQDKWERLTTPVWDGAKEAKVSNLPEMPNIPGMPQIGAANVQIGGFAAMGFTTQFSQAWATFATNTLSLSDYGLPFATPGRIIAMPGNFDRIRMGTQLNREEGLFYVAAREAATQRLFAAAPWLEENIFSAWKETMSNLYIDGSGLHDALMNAMNNQEGEQSFTPGPFEVPLEMVFQPSNAEAAQRLLHLLTMVEAWVNVVVDNALRGRVKSLDEIKAAWERRAKSGGELTNVIKALFNVNMPSADVAAAEQLWQRIDTAVGQERRDHLWDHPEFLPSYDDISNSAPFIDSLLDESSFDPIAEINNLLQQGDTGHPESEEDQD
ncbi:MAG: zinc-dependent metalloprotease [Corynebacterium sp.]|nr:zinc-dependent metalloprotease [Corynebacterium sp.]